MITRTDPMILWDKDGRKKGKSTAYGKKDVTNKGNITSYRLIKCE